MIPAAAAVWNAARRRSAVLAAVPSALPAVLAAACAAAALFLATHHPLAPAAATAGVLGWALLSFLRPQWWLLLLPALLPVAQLGPWSGWIGVEEFDLLVLATAAGLHARRARTVRAGGTVPPLPAAARALAWALGGWTLLGLLRGLHDAGGAALGWFDGYTQPLNVWRVSKPALWALLLLPALHQALQADAARALCRLRRGMLAGLALVAGTVLWERAAYVGLLEFTRPYRTTGPFWEMHVGGAAIDACLALSAPFVVWTLWRLRRPLPWCAVALLAVATTYAVLTTFSRGVYGAVLLPLLVPLAWLVLRRAGPGRLRGLLKAALLTAAAVGPLVWAAQALEIMGVALLLGLWLVAALAVWRFSRIGWRDAAAVTLAVALLAEVVAVLTAGSFMRERLDASEQDLHSRMAHWERGLSLLQAPAQWGLGLGPGRLPAHYAKLPGQPGFPGSVRPQDGGVRLQGRTSPGGGILGLTQRVPLHRGPYWLHMRVKAEAPVRLLMKVCEAHLLYDVRCQAGLVQLGQLNGRYPLQLQLPGPPLDQSGLPRSAVLSLVVQQGALVVDDVRLYAGGVQLLRNGGFADGLAHWWPVAQGYFVPWHIDNLYLELLIERGLPGLALFGVMAGAALWRLLRAMRARHEVAEAAAFVAAALCGGLLLGLLNSVLDMPRVAWLLWLLVFTGLVMPVASRGGDPVAPRS